MIWVLKMLKNFGECKICFFVFPIAEKKHLSEMPFAGRHSERLPSKILIKTFLLAEKQARLPEN